MERLEEYCKLLKAIYGKRLLEYFTTKDENLQTLTMNNEANNQLKVKGFDRSEGEGCDICKDKFRNKENFYKRNLEFPGWIGNLNFSNNTPAKEIMIIGEAPPRLKVQVNIAFGLGYFPIDTDGNLGFDQLYKTYSEDKSRADKIKKDQEKKMECGNI